MYTNLKNEIEKDFRKETNYNTIISKIEKKKWMESTKVKYILAPTCSVLIGIVSFIGVKNHLQREGIIITDMNKGQVIQKSEEENSKDIINFNSDIYADNTSYLFDVKWIDENLMKKFNFLNNIYIPEYLSETRQGKIYVRDGLNDESYSKFQQYSLVFFNYSVKENIEVSIDFSKEKLLPRYISSDIDSAEESLINNTEVKLFATELKRTPTKISGEAYFEYNNYKFYIKVYSITKDEFIQIVKSVIAEFKANLPVEDN